MKLRVGDVVRIRYYGENPDFWDDDGTMYSHMGEAHKIIRENTPGRFQLEGLSWNWREEDFILLVRRGHDPNYTFKTRKRRGLL